MRDAKVLLWNYKVPVVVDERVPLGMAVLGYDKDGKLVAAMNIGASVPVESLLDDDDMAVIRDEAEN